MSYDTSLKSYFEHCCSYNFNYDREKLNAFIKIFNIKGQLGADIYKFRWWREKFPALDLDFFEKYSSYDGEDLDSFKLSPDDPEWRLMVKSELDSLDSVYIHGAWNFLRQVNSFKCRLLYKNGCLNNIMDHWQAFRTYNKEIVIISSLNFLGYGHVTKHPAFPYIVKKCLPIGSWLSPNQTLLILNTKVKDLDLKIQQYSAFLKNHKRS